jgi:hypothetical protein
MDEGRISLVRLMDGHATTAVEDVLSRDEL